MIDEERYSQIRDRIFNDYPDEVLRNILPNQVISNLSSYDRVPDNFELGYKNKNYQGSDYYIDPKQQKFIHFTSLERLCNIISTNKIRLYDLNNVDDPNEIIFPLKQVGADQDVDFNRVKSGVFSFSFCDFSTLADEKVEYNMWRLYGSDGNGVGIVFKFLNDCNAWDGYHLSKVYYEDAIKIQTIADAIKSHEKFFSTLNETFGFINSISKENLLSEILNLFCFHKYGIYIYENEFRLVYRKNPYNYNVVYTISKHKKLSSYIEIPLGTIQNFQPLNDAPERPLIMIDEIILGHRYNEKECESLKGTLFEVNARNSELFSTKTPQVSLTQLKKKYFS